MAAAVRKGIKISGAFLFGIYIIFLVYALFFAEGYGRGADGALIGCNTVPFREIMRYLRYRDVLGNRAVFLNLAGNVIGFMPFGALLPVMARDARKAWKTGLLGFEISALVELSQLLFQVGCFDVDDMILNTCGALAGYSVFYVCSRWYLRLGGLSGVAGGVQRQAEGCRRHFSGRH